MNRVTLTWPITSARGRSSTRCVVPTFDPNGPGRDFRSCLYACRVLHHRLAPREHRFVYRLFYFAFDLDELPALSRRIGLLSVDRANVFSFHERDFLPIAEPMHRISSGRTLSLALPNGATLKQRVVAFCAAHGVDLGSNPRIQLVTLPRLFGHQFNPVSFYFCHDTSGAPRAAIAEVTNTFREIKPYLIPIGGTSASTAAFRLRVPKHFYVSPFSSVDVEFDFTLRAPGEKLAVQIDDYDAGRRTLHTTLTGERISLTNARLAWFLIKYPLITLKIIGGIHWEALRLWVKRLPLYRKADGAGRQRDLFRPYPSDAEESTT